RFDETEARRFDDLPADLEYPPVIDGLRQVVVDPGRLEVRHQLDVHGEWLRLDLLALVDAVASKEAHVVEDDSIGHPARPLTMESAMRAVRTFGRTSCTRTISMPAA